MKKIIYFLFVSIIFISCSSENNKSHELFINVGSEPKTIDPALNIAIADSTYIIHAFEGLLSKDNEGKLIGAAAERWDISEDGLVYTFHLRTNAKWSDGVDVTAEDFVYSWRRVVDKNTASKGSLQLEPIKNAKDIIFGKLNSDSLGVKAIDNHTFEVTLEKPLPYFLELTALSTFYPVRKDIIEKYGDSWTMNPESYIGNGPYMMIERNIDDKIVMVRNANYWDYWNLGPEKITFIIMNNPTSSEAAIKEGSLHFSTIIQNNDIDKLRDEGFLRYINKLGVVYYALNITNEILKDDRVRKALALGIDRNYIVNNVLGGGRVAADGFVPINVKIGTNDFRENAPEYISLKESDYQKNIEEAKKLLADAGYSDIKKFPIIELITTTNPSSLFVAEAIQSMYKNNLGIDLKLRYEEPTSYLQSIKDGSFQMIKARTSVAYNQAAGYLRLFQLDGLGNDGGYTNEVYDYLVDIAMTNANEDIRIKAAYDAERILIEEDMAIIPIYYDKATVMQSKKLHGVKYDIFSVYDFRNSYIE